MCGLTKKLQKLLPSTHIGLYKGWVDARKLKGGDEHLIVKAILACAILNEQNEDIINNL